MRLAAQRRNRAFAAAAGLAAALTIAFTVWVSFRLGTLNLTEWIDDLGEAVAAFVAVAACAVAALRQHRRLRLAWALMALSAFSWACGELVWCYYELGRGVQVPFPSPADAGYLGSVPLAVAAVITFMVGRSGRASLIATVLDGGIMAGSFLLISWASVLGTIYRAGADSRMAQLIGLAYPISDVIVLTMVLLLVTRTARSGQLPLYLLAGGLLANLLADSGFAYLTTVNAYGAAQPIDAGWVAGYLLIGLAAFRAAQIPSPDKAAANASDRRWRLLLPYIALAAAAATGSARTIVSGLDAFVFWTMLAVAALVVVRQFVVLVDNLSLTQRLRVQVATVAEREEQLRSLVEHSAEVLTLADSEGMIRYQSASVERIFAYAPDELLGRRLGDLVHPQDQSAFAIALAKALRASAHPVTFSCRVRHALGSFAVCEVTITNMLYLPSVEGLVVNIRDVSDRKQLEEQVVHGELHDPVTGLLNRRAFRESVERALEAETAGLAVMLLDADDFKAINQAVGYEAGDELLGHIGARLKQELRPTDLVARTGGDEFGILLVGVRNASDGDAVAQRVQSRFRASFRAGRHDVVVSFSIGMALARPGQEGATDLLRRADSALHQAKLAGQGSAVQAA